MVFFVFFDGKKNLVTAPHSSSERYDSDYVGSCDRGTDLIAKKVSSDLDFNLLLPSFSRFIVDFNRSRSDAILENFKIYNLPEVSFDEKEKRLIEYDAYYKKVDDVVANESVGFHISIHSMTPFGSKNTVDEGVVRPDFRIGTLNGKSVDRVLLERFVSVLRDKGFRVEIDNYFCGGEEVKFISGLGINSLQVEINSKLILKDDFTGVCDVKCNQVGKVIVECFGCLSD